MHIISNEMHTVIIEDVSNYISPEAIME